MLGYLNIGVNEIKTIKYDALFSDSFLYAVSTPDYDSYSIAGRNGELHISNNRFSNIKYSINGFIPCGFEHSYLPLRTKLLNLEGYKRFEHTNNKKYYRLAKIQEISPISSNKDKDIVTFSIDVSMRPEIFLKKGEETYFFESNGTIENPCPTISKPLIRVYGKGTLTVGTTIVEIKEGGTEYIDIDVEKENASEGVFNRNGNILVTNWGGLIPKTNVINMDSTISKIEIIPRWYLL